MSDRLCACSFVKAGEGVWPFLRWSSTNWIASVCARRMGEARWGLPRMCIPPPRQPRRPLTSLFQFQEAAAANAGLPLNTCQSRQAALRAGHPHAHNLKLLVVCYARRRCGCGGVHSSTWAVTSEQNCKKKVYVAQPLFGLLAASHTDSHN